MTSSQPIGAPFVVEILNGYLNESHLWADVGCGPGLYAKSVHAQCVGIDKDCDDYAEGIKRSVDVVSLGDCLPLEQECLDLIMSKSAFYQFPDPIIALKEFSRVLKPGGRLLIVDYNQRTQRKLEIGEKANRPCWSQWELKRLIENAGFGHVELLLPVKRQPHKLIGLPLLFLQELLGSWAIVTAVKRIC